MIPPPHEPPPEAGRDAFHRVPNLFGNTGRGGTRSYQVQGFNARIFRRILSPSEGERVGVRVFLSDRIYVSANNNFSSPLFKSYSGRQPNPRSFVASATTNPKGSISAGLASLIKPGFPIIWPRVLAISRTLTPIPVPRLIVPWNFFSRTVKSAAAKSWI